MALDFSKLDELRNRMPKIDLNPPNDDADSLGEAAWSGLKAGTGNLLAMNADIAAMSQYLGGGYDTLPEAMNDKGDFLRPIYEYGKGVEARNSKNYTRHSGNWWVNSVAQQAPQFAELALLAKAAAPVVGAGAAAGAFGAASKVAPKLAPAIGTLAETAAPMLFANVATQVPMEMTDKMRQELTDPETGEMRTDPESLRKAHEYGLNVGALQMAKEPFTTLAQAALMGGGGRAFQMGKAGMKEAAGLTGKEALAAAQKAGAKVTEDFVKRDALNAVKAGAGKFALNQAGEGLDEVGDDFVVPALAKGQLPTAKDLTSGEALDTFAIGAIASAPQGLMAHHLNKQAGRQYLAGLQSAENMHNITNAAEQAPTGNFDNKQPKTPDVTPTDEASARRAIVEAARADIDNHYGDNDCTTRVNSWYGAAGANQRNAWAPTSMQDAIESGNFFDDFNKIEDGDIVYWDNGSGEADHVGVWDAQAEKVIQSGATGGVQYMDLNYMRPLGFSKPTFGNEIKVGSTNIPTSDLDMTVNEGDLGNRFYEIYKGIAEQNEEMGRETTYSDYLEAITSVADSETATRAAEVLNMGDENAIASMANELGYAQNEEMYANKGLSPKVKKALDTTGEVKFQNKELADTFMANHPTYQRLNDTTVAAPASYKRPDVTEQTAPKEESSVVSSSSVHENDTPQPPVVSKNTPAMADEAQAEEDLQSLLNDVPPASSNVPPMVNAVPGAQTADDVINQITQSSSTQNPPVNMQKTPANMQNPVNLAENTPNTPQITPNTAQTAGTVPQMAGNGTPVPSGEVSPVAKGTTKAVEETPLKTANSAEAVMDEIANSNPPAEPASKEEVESVISDIKGMEQEKSPESESKREEKATSKENVPEKGTQKEVTNKKPSDVEQENKSKSQEKDGKGDILDSSEDLTDEKKIENFIETMLKKSSNKRVSKSAKLAAKIATRLLNSVANTYRLNGVTGYVDGLIKRLTIIPNSDVNSVKGGIVRRQNAGENAVTAPRDELAAAELMEQMGKSPQEILRETGWFRNDDGKWRFYIPDNLDGINLKKFRQITSKKSGTDEHKQTTIDKIYDNPALFAAYPFLRDIKITQNDKMDAFGMAGDGLIEINFKYVRKDGKPVTDEEHRKTIVHEIQHIIQEHEGFAEGYSDEDKETAAKVLKKDISEVTQDDMDDVYRRAAGEREARLAEELAGIESKKAKLPFMERAFNAEINARLLTRNEDSLIIFGDALVADAKKLNQDARAATVIAREADQSSYVVNLMESADESTFIHEAVHILKEELRRAAEAFPDSQAAKDYEAFEKWCGYQEGQLSEYEGTATEKEFTDRNNAIKEAAEKGDTELADALKEEWADERLARGFEQYLKDGTTPTKGVKTLFEKFKSWLTDIYKQFIGVGAKPSVEVKAVFDRMMGVPSNRVKNVADVVLRNVKTNINTIQISKEPIGSEAYDAKFRASDINEYEEKVNSVVKEAEEALKQRQLPDNAVAEAMSVIEKYADEAIRTERLNQDEKSKAEAETAKKDAEAEVNKHSKEVMEKFHGFMKDAPEMTKAKVTQTLEKRYNWGKNGTPISGVMSRAEYIEEVLKYPNDFEVLHQTKKGQDPYIVRNRPNNQFGMYPKAYTKITKTEYDYYQYLSNLKNAEPIPQKSGNTQKNGIEELSDKDYADKLGANTTDIASAGSKLLAKLKPNSQENEAKHKAEEKETKTTQNLEEETSLEELDTISEDKALNRDIKFSADVDGMEKFNADTYAKGVDAGIQVMRGLAKEKKCTFSNWSKAMIDVFGNKVKSWLGSIYDTIRNLIKTKTRFDPEVVAAMSEFTLAHYSRGSKTFDSLYNELVNLAGEDLAKQYRPTLEAAYAGVQRWESDVIEARHEKQRAAAEAEKAETAKADDGLENIRKNIDRLVDENFNDNSDPTVVQAFRDILSADPENPAKFYNELVKENKSNIKAELKGMVDHLKSGMGNGVDLVDLDDGSGRMGRVSNNAPWYQRWYKAYGRKPTVGELEDIATAAILGEANSYVPDELVPRTYAQHEELVNSEDAESLRSLLDERKVLEALQDVIPNIKKGELLEAPPAGDVKSKEKIGGNANVHGDGRKSPERNSGGNNQNSVGADNGDGQPTRGDGRNLQPDREGNEQSDSDSLRNGSPAPSRETSDSGVQSEISGSDRVGRPRNTELSGSVRDSLSGVENLEDGRKAEDIRPSEDGRLNEASVSEHLSRLTSDIRKDMPFLHAAQAETVAWAEDRFFNEDEWGALCSDGTGTGKTFEGLGVIKRMVEQGKSNILIVTPSQSICKAWIDAGTNKSFFGLNMSALESTKTAGKGIVTTTYANLATNNELVNRDWDMVIVDESHKLMSGGDGATPANLSRLRALTYHPSGFFERSRLLHYDDYKRASEIATMLEGEPSRAAGYFNKKETTALIESGEKLGAGEKENLRKEADDLQKKLYKYRAEEIAKWGDIEKKNRPKVFMLSATAFSYEKNIDYGNGYLFDYPTVDANGTWIDPNMGFNQFMIDHLGYRWRYGRLEKPSQSVDSALLQQRFNSWLRSTGAMKGRLLDVPVDYDNGFLVTNSAVGKKIDDAVDMLSHDSRFAALAGIVLGSSHFGTSKQRYLLEYMNAKEAVNIAREYVSKGYKVVVMHKSMKDQEPVNPFNLENMDWQSLLPVMGKDGVARAMGEYQTFKKEHPDLVDNTSLGMDDLKPTVETFREAFGNRFRAFNGNESKKGVIEAFNAHDRVEEKYDKSGKVINADKIDADIISVQMDAGGAGISLHDVVGDKPRVTLYVAAPTKPSDLTQTMGRTLRDGTKSNVIFRFITTGTRMEDRLWTNVVATRATEEENLSQGESAQVFNEMLKMKYAETYTGEWERYKPGSEGEGTGGRAEAKMLSDKISGLRNDPFNVAKTEYEAWHNGKKKINMGKDYYPTPEPLGLMMTRWAGISEGDKVLEPSAGHGAISRWFPKNATRKIIEPYHNLMVQAQMNSDIDESGAINGDFMEHHISNKYDEIVMNPPFGKAASEAIPHFNKALKHLKDSGRLVAILPNSPKMIEAVNKTVNEDETLFVRGVVKLPQCTFKGSGTPVSTLLYIVDKQGSAIGKGEMSRSSTAMHDLTDIQDINELFDAIKDIKAPERYRHNYVTPEMREHAMATFTSAYQKIVAACPAVSGGGIKMFNRLARLMPNGDIQFIGNVSVTPKLIEQMDSIGAKYDENLKGFYFDNAVDVINGMRDAIMRDSMANFYIDKYPTVTGNDWVAKVNMATADKKVAALKEMQESIVKRQQKEIDFRRPNLITNANTVLDTEVIKSARIGYSVNSFHFVTDFPEALTDALNDHGLVVNRIIQTDGGFKVTAIANNNAVRSELLSETLGRNLSDMELAYDSLRNRTNEPVNKVRKDIGRIVTSAMTERASEPSIRFLDGSANLWAFSNGVVSLHARNTETMQNAEELLTAAGAKPVVDTDGNDRLDGSKDFTFNSVKKFLDFWNENAVGNNVLHALDDLPDRAATAELLAEERGKRIEEEADLPKPPEPTPVKHNSKQATAEMHTDTRTGELTPKVSIPSIDKNEYKVVSGIAKSHGGYWSRFAKGFLFKDEASRDAALYEINLMLDGGVNEMRFSAENEQEHDGFIAKAKESEVKPSDYGFTQNILAKFANSLGHEIKFFRGNSSIRGAWDGDTFYLNENANVPIHYVFFHEFTHWMKDQHPGMFSQIAATFQARNGISREAVESYRKRVKFSRRATNDAVVEEIMADALMHSNIRKDLFNQMLKTNLKPWAYVLARMYYAVQDNFMNPLQNAPKGFDLSQINKLNVEMSSLLAKVTDAEGNKLFKVDAKGHVLLDYHTGEKIKATDLEDGIESPIDDVRYSGDNESKYYKGVVEKNPYTPISNALFTDTAVEHMEQGFGLSNVERNTISAKISDEIKQHKGEWGDLTQVGSHATVRDYKLKTLIPLYHTFNILTNKGVPIDDARVRTLATQIMYGWRCFENDNRIEDEQPTKGGSVESSSMGESVQTGADGTDGNIGAGNGLARKEKGGRRNVVGEISEFVTDRKKVLKAYGKTLDDYKNLHYKKPVPKTPEVEIKYSAENPGYTNNKDTHKSQDMRQINRWAIERLCDRLGIPLTPFLVKHGLKSAGGNIVERMPLSDSERDPMQRRDINPLQEFMRSPRKLKEIFPKLAPIVDAGIRAMTRQEKLRYGYTEGMNAVEKLLGYNKWKKNDPLYEARKQSLINILGAGDAYVMNFTDDELTSGILSVKHIDQLKRQGKSSDEIGEIRDVLSEIKTEDKKVIESYKKIRKMSDHAFKITNDTKMGIHTVTKNVTASKLEELKAMERAKGGTFIKILNVNSLGRRYAQEEMYTVTYRQPRLTRSEVDATPEEVEMWRDDPQKYVVSAIPTDDPGKVKCIFETAPEPLKYHAGHVPHVFEGFLIAREWGEDKGGSLDTHYEILGSADTLMGARKKALGIAGKRPNEKIVLVPKFFRYEHDTDHAVVMGDKDYERAISKMAETMKIPVSEFSAMTKNAITTKNRGRFFGHLIDRKGAKGYDENYFRALRHYYNQAARYVALDDFKRSSYNWYEREFGNFDLEPQTPLAKYAKNYINDVNGVPVELENTLNRAIEHIPFLREIASTKVAGRPALYFAGVLTKIGTYTKLGLPNVASTLIQYTQLLNMLGALDGGLRKGGSYIAEGISMYRKALKDENGEMAQLLNKDLGLPYQIGAEVAGGYSNNEKQRGLFGGFRYAEIVNNLIGGSMWAFRKADKDCRAVTLLGAYKKAIDNGMTKPEAIKYAQDICAEVNFDYAVADAPGMFRRLGPVGSIMFQFQKYPVKQLEYFKMLFDRGYERGGTKGAMAEVTKYLAPYVLLAGIGGVPLLGTLMTAISFFMAHGDDDEWDWKEKLKKALLTNHADNPFVRTAIYGIGGALPGGVDIGYRVGIGDFAAADMRAPQSVPEMGWRAFGVTTGSLYNAWKQWHQNGNVAEGIKAISPGIGNLLIAYNGEVRTTRGRVRYKYDSYWQRFLRAIGVTPIEERVTTDLNRIDFKDRKAQRNAKYQAIDDFIDDPTPENLAIVKAVGASPTQVQSERQRKKLTSEEMKNGKPSNRWQKPKLYMDSEYYR